MGQTAEELKQEVAYKRADLSRDLESIGDRVSPERMVERRKAAVGQRVEGVKHRLMGVGDSARNRMHDTSASLSGTASSIGDTAHGVTGRAHDMAEGSPLAMGLVAFGAGLVAAIAFPSSRTEADLAQRAEPVLQRAATQTGSSARGLIDEAKPVLQEAAESVKESAGESVSNIRETATQGAAAVRDEVRSTTSE